MRVNVDDIAFMDRRFKLLGGRLGMAWQEALGRCLPVWALAYAKRTPILPAGDVDALAERTGFVTAMVAVGLASEEPGDDVYLCGVSDRIDFLLMQDAKREKAREARLAAAGVAKSPGPSRGKKVESPGPSRGEVPGTGSYSPDLAPDTSPEDQKLSPARDPAVPPAVPVPHQQHVPPDGPTSNEVKKSEPRAPDRAVHPPPNGPSPIPTIAQRAAIRAEVRELINAARVRVGAKHGAALNQLLAFEHGIDADLAGQLALAPNDAELEATAAKARHAIAMAELEATLEPDRIQFLNGAIFSGRNFARLSSQTPAGIEAAVRRRAGPQRSAERATGNQAVKSLIADIAAREAAGET